ncbi:hypothetical protein COO60DRAFT_1561461 [Scenedesmus sp. NREL 46B-D3]|nr:hypothetical protein COO60DRAFT_1561461 [Scenedesmus sp. NREL 46B-D3]
MQVNPQCVYECMFTRTGWHLLLLLSAAMAVPVPPCTARLACSGCTCHMSSVACCRRGCSAGAWTVRAPKGSYNHGKGTNECRQGGGCPLPSQHTPGISNHASEATAAHSKYIQRKQTTRRPLQLHSQQTTAR